MVMRKPLRRLQPLHRRSKLLIEDEHIRRHPMPALQKARRKVHTALARTAHHDHFMRGKLAKAQPPIVLFLLPTHENKIQTPSPRVHPFRRKGTHKGRRKHNLFKLACKRTTRLPISRMRLYTGRVMERHFKTKGFQHARQIRHRRPINSRLTRFHSEPQAKPLVLIRPASTPKSNLPGSALPTRIPRLHSSPSRPARPPARAAALSRVALLSSQGHELGLTVI